MAYFRSGISNIQKFKGTAVDVADLPSPIASFRSNASGVKLDSLKVLVEAVQSGSGTPSPDNVRPITGWSGANVTRTGKNLFGGQAMVDNALSIRGSASRPPIDDTNNTVTVNSAQESAKLIFKPTVKENTAYTFIMTYSKNQDSRASNLRIEYTDGTATNIPALSNDVPYGTKGTVVVTTTSGKTIKGLYGINQATTSTFYCDECGMFEGSLTASDFVPYNGNTYTIAFGDTYYGGELDVTNGVLRVVKAIVDLGSLNWNTPTNRSTYYGLANIIKVPINAGVLCGAIAEKYHEVPSNSSLTTDGQFAVGTNGYLYFYRVTDTPTGMFVYPLATPIEIQLTPTQIGQLLGDNNVFADCGDVSECKYIQISQIGG